MCDDHARLAKPVFLMMSNVTCLGSALCVGETVDNLTKEVAARWRLSW